MPCPQKVEHRGLGTRRENVHSYPPSLLVTTWEIDASHPRTFRSVGLEGLHSREEELSPGATARIPLSSKPWLLSCLFQLLNTSDQQALVGMTLMEGVIASAP